MRFSVVITCYNYGDYVCDAVASTLAQTHPPHDVVVVDDGSTDDSFSRLTARFRGTPSVRLLAQQNSGQFTAFVTGCQAASGDIICFLDADDLWEPGYLAALESVYSRKAAPDMVLANLRQFGNADAIWYDRAADEVLGLGVLTSAFLLTIPQAPTSSISVRRALVLRVLDIPESLRVDWRTRADDCVILGAHIFGAVTISLAEPLVRYRVHGANVWAMRPMSKLESARYKLAIATLANWYAAQASIGTQALAAAYLEFRTKSFPSWEQLFTYLWLQWRAPQPLSMLPRPVASIIRHFVESRRQPRT